MGAISILIGNSLVNINLEPLLLSVSPLLVRAQAMFFFRGENEGVYWEEKAAKMRVSVTGQEAWGFSPFSPMLLSLPNLLKRHKRRN